MILKRIRMKTIDYQGEGVVYKREHFTGDAPQWWEKRPEAHWERVKDPELQLKLEGEHEEKDD